MKYPDWVRDYQCFPTFKPKSNIEPPPVDSAILLTAAFTDQPLPPPGPALCPTQRVTATRIAEVHGRALVGLMQVPRGGGGADHFLILSWRWSDSALTTAVHSAELVASERGGPAYSFDWIGDAAIQASWRREGGGPNILCRLRKETVVLAYSKLVREMSGCFGSRRVGGVLRITSPLHLLLYCRL